MNCAAPGVAAGTPAAGGSAPWPPCRAQSRVSACRIHPARGGFLRRPAFFRTGRRIRAGPPRQRIGEHRLLRLRPAASFQGARTGRKAARPFRIRRPLLRRKRFVRIARRDDAGYAGQIASGAKPGAPDPRRRQIRILAPDPVSSARQSNRPALGPPARKFPRAPGWPRFAEPLSAFRTGWIPARVRDPPNRPGTRAR